METIEPQLLDACGLINVCASGRVIEIAAFFRGLFVVDDVAEEAPGAILVAGVAIQVLSLTDAEAEMFIALAAIDGMDAGEAATFAVAASRELPVATDDRRAIRAAREQVPDVRINSTPTLIRAFAEGASLDAVSISEIVQTIEADASFVPAGGGADVVWWESVRGL
jgi:predicted nucleic acid-binding protein